MVRPMKFVSLFAGVGGFDLGLTRSGHTCVGQVEIDKHARSILDKKFPAIPKHDDVTTARDWAEVVYLENNPIMAPSLTPIPAKLTGISPAKIVIGR